MNIVHDYIQGLREKNLDNALAELLVNDGLGKKSLTLFWPATHLGLRAFLLR